GQEIPSPSPMSSYAPAVAECRRGGGGSAPGALRSGDRRGAAPTGTRRRTRRVPPPAQPRANDCARSFELVATLDPGRIRVRQHVHAGGLAAVEGASDGRGDLFRVLHEFA